MADARPFHWEYQAPPVQREAFRVVGGSPLQGTVAVSGSKNAALKLLAAATLTGERCRFTNVPEIADVAVMVETLGDLGIVVDHPAPNTYEVASGDVDWLFVPLEAAAKMRASFILLGPLLARFGRVIMSNPGGDRIGRRPVNLHVDAMRGLGAEIDYRNGYYFARSPGRLRGADITFPMVTVMGTENALLAAALADGHTTIRPAAQEPEVDDLIAFLQRMGAEVERTAPDTIEVEGRRRLRGADHRVIAGPHRGGHVHGRGGGHGRRGHPHRRAPPAPRGVPGDPDRDGCRGGLGGRHAHRAGGRTRARTARWTSRRLPIPGLATDLQSPTAVLLTQAHGTSHIHETIFEDRLEWMDELRRMGASVDIPDPHHAILRGPSQLHGAEVEMGDLRAGASLMLAALAADGTSLIHGAHQVRRGYENIEGKFLDLGARIEVVSEGSSTTS